LASVAWTAPAPTIREGMARSQPSGTKVSACLLDTWVCRLRIAVPFDRTAAGAALFTVRFDDRHLPITQTEDVTTRDLSCPWPPVPQETAT